MSLPFKAASLQQLANAALKSKRVSLLPSGSKAQPDWHRLLRFVRRGSNALSSLTLTVLCIGTYAPSGELSCFHAFMAGVFAVKASLQHVSLLLQAAKKYASRMSCHTDCVG